MPGIVDLEVSDRAREVADRMTSERDIIKTCDAVSTAVLARVARARADVMRKRGVRDDDLYEKGELVSLALYFLQSPSDRKVNNNPNPFPKYKPRVAKSDDDVAGRLRDLQNAAQLCLAEMERIIRKEMFA